MRWSFAAFAAHQRCGAPGIRAAQRSLTLTLSRQRARELEGGGVDWRETRCNLTPNPFPCGKGNNRAFSASELASYLCWKRLRAGVFCPARKRLDVAFLCLSYRTDTRFSVACGKVVLVGVHRDCATWSYSAGQRSTVHGCAGVQGDRGVGEYVSLEDATRSDRRRTADLPVDVGRFRAVDQDNVAVWSGQSERRRRHLEDPDRVRVVLGVQGEIRSGYLERVRAGYIETREENLGAQVLGDGRCTQQPGCDAIGGLKGGQRRERRRIVNLYGSVHDSGRESGH